MKKGTAPPPVRILLVDDHPIVREGLALFLGSDPAMQVCGQADDTTEALRILSTVPVDLMILDLNLGGSSGLDLLSASRERFPEVLVLVLSMHGEPELIRRAIQLGAAGFVRKQDAPNLLFSAINRALAGEVHIPPSLSRSLLQPADSPHMLDETAPPPALTEREEEILRLIGEGRSPGEIAAGLGISPRTVDAHQTNLKKKLGAGTTRELLLFAARFRHPHSA